MNTRGNVERAVEGSWKDKEDDFDIGDRVMLRYQAELYGFCGRKAQKGWDKLFIIKKVRENREIMIWDEVMWYIYVDPSDDDIIIWL